MEIKFWVYYLAGRRRGSECVVLNNGPVILMTAYAKVEWCPLKSEPDKQSEMIDIKKPSEMEYAKRSTLKAKGCIQGKMKKPTFVPILRDFGGRRWSIGESNAEN